MAVYDGLNDRSSQKFSKKQKEEKEEKENNISPSSAYVASAIEALAASGVFEDAETDDNSDHFQKIGVYGNNQSIVRDEEAEKIGHQYLKHFYEKNEVLEEVDELV